MMAPPRLGALIEGAQVRFRVWAPRARVELELVAPRAQRIAMQPVGDGYYEALVATPPGTRYFYRLDGERRRPDPASRAQPEGVHGPSEVVDPSAFIWRHAAPNRSFADYVIYELHVGTFTPEGTFISAIAELPRLVELGVTAVELMPVASFPGRRNWGYDGVGWFAPQGSYGGPEALRRLVDACHGLGLSVVADVVYNHLGPEGNYLPEFGPYFTSSHHTPWGDAINFDGADAAGVRAHVLANARMYFDEFRVDALRLDAVHTIVDTSPRHIVAELTALAGELGRAQSRTLCVVAESDLGDVRVIEGADRGGWGCDGQWSDDFHHALHALVTGERSGYYVDYGDVAALTNAISDGFAYTGQWSQFRRRPFGMPAKHIAGDRFVIYSQNHDQVGNRARGERLGMLQPRGGHAAAALLLTAPAVPLLFMGEEYGELAPFLYFTDHQDAGLARAVSLGRQREFDWTGVAVPDPQALETFTRSRLDVGLRAQPPHASLERFYRALLRLRRERPSLRLLDKSRTEVRSLDKLVEIRRSTDVEETLVLVNLAPAPVAGEGAAPRSGRWQVLLDAGDPAFGGPVGARLEDKDRAPQVVLPPYGVLVCGTRPERGS